MTSKKPPQLADRHSLRKRKFFTLLMLGFPLVLLCSLEIALRVFNYGGNLSLVIRRTVGGKEVYSINPAVTRRYFAHANVIPQPVDDTFAIKKSKKTRRIFCLGESTMAGFPYEYHATGPSLLRDRLQAMLPQYEVEVINVGLSAIGTFVIQDFLEELTSYDPDLFIVYAGHNEFYGIYGVGSSISLPGGPWLTRLNIGLLKFKSFLLLRDGYVWIGQQFGADIQKQSQGLMGQMVGNQAIPLHDREYEAAREIYCDNITRLITTARSRNIPIMFSTLVSNWRGQKPFVSQFDATTSAEDKARWQGSVANGDSALAAKDSEKAMLWYARAARIDSLNAAAFFKLGTVLYSLSRFDEARQALLRAKDLDALRFRATEEFQNDLIRICMQFNVPMARVDSSFVNASPHGILDDSLFLEHLHPNINGYFLMAKTFCQAMMHNNLLLNGVEWASASSPTDSMLMDFSRITEFDRAVGKVKVDLLKRRWPFETGQVNYQFVASNSVESVVFKMMKGDLQWSEARYLLAEYYAHNKQLDLARKECLAVAKVFPLSYKPLLRCGDYYRLEGNKEEAKRKYQQCFEIDDNPFARMRYAALLLEEGNANGAIANADVALDLDARGKYKLPLQSAAAARYLLAVSYAELGKVDEAKQNLQRTLAIDPAHRDAKELLTRLTDRK